MISHEKADGLYETGGRIRDYIMSGDQYLIPVLIGVLTLSGEFLFYLIAEILSNIWAESDTIQLKL